MPKKGLNRDLIIEAALRLVENGDTSSAEAEEAVRSRIEPLIAAGADQIVLGCTHYPLARDEIKRAAGEGVRIFDGADGTARHTKNILERLSLNSLARKIGTVEFISSDGTDHLEQFFYKRVNKGTK